MKYFFNRKLMLGLIVIASFLFTGCASIKNAPISEKSKAVDITNESIGYMTLKVSNSKNTSYQPNIKYAFIWDDKKANRKKYSFKVIDAYKKVDDSYNEYIITFQLKPGDYVLREIFGQSGFFPVIGSFSVPMYKSITLPENKFIYFGHVDANIVDRTSDEQLRAGPVIPLIDQAVVGASGGTFIIDIKDNYENDVKLLKEEFSYLSDVEIENMTLSQWEKPTKEEMQ